MMIEKNKRYIKVVYINNHEHIFLTILIRFIILLKVRFVNFHQCKNKICLKITVI